MIYFTTQKYLKKIVGQGLEKQPKKRYIYDSWSYIFLGKVCQVIGWNPSCDTTVEAVKVAVVNVLTNGEGTCRWCGQGDIDVLAIDHIANNGQGHRRKLGGSSLYRWIIREGYPEGYQILCWNCNWKKRMIGLREAVRHNTIKRFEALGLPTDVFTRDSL